MKHSTIIKGLTLFSSIFLVLCFLFYRAGKLDGGLSKDSSANQTSPNGGTITSNKTDTLKSKKDSTSRLRLSSSKSMVLAEPAPVTKFDTIARRLQKAGPTKQTQFLPSSKSGSVFDRDALSKIKIDSFKLDTTKKKKP